MPETREYSSWLGVLTPAQIQAALQRHGLGDLVEAAPASEGIYGQTVFVTATTGQYVLRGRPIIPGQFNKERFAAEQLHRAGRIPVPHPSLLDETTDIFGWPYLLMPRLPGGSAYDWSRSVEEQAQVARAIALGLARMQELSWECAGEYDAASSGIRPFAHGYGGWLIEQTRQSLAEGIAEGFITSADAGWADAVISEASAALAEPVTPCFVHADFHPGNLLVARENGAWRVTGLVDLPGWYFGGAEPDLVRTVATYLEVDNARRDEPRLAVAFGSAYLQARPPGPGFEGRYRIAMLRDRLLVWNLEHRRRLGLVSIAGHLFREYAERHLASYQILLPGSRPVAPLGRWAPAPRLEPLARLPSQPEAAGPRQFQAALARHGLGDLVAAEPAADGIHQQAFLVTSSTGRYVLRGGPGEAGRLQKECFGAGVLHRAGLPVAHPCLVDEAPDLFGWPYLLAPRQDGVTGNLSKRSVGEKLWVARALGAMLARIHQVRWPFAGRFDPASREIQPFAGGYASWLMEDTKQLLEGVRASGFLTPDDVSWALGIIEPAGSSPGPAFEPCFVMGNYHPGNVLVSCPDGEWQVTGLLDLGDFHMGDGETDVICGIAACLDADQHQDTRLARAFSEACFAGGRPRTGFAERFAFAMVRDRLRIWRHLNARQHGAEPKRLSFRQYTERYLAGSRFLWQRA